MDLNKIKNTVTEKAQEVLGDEQKTDAVLDKAAELANKATGGKHADKVETARAEADKRIGEETANN
ncbi:MAG: antitoxin [Actinomycetaceae bacterium]|nr:antitoxin [Actinomycetaceae bacterium]